MPAEPSPNQALLEEILDSGAWVHVRKTKPIQVKRLDLGEVVQTIEGLVTAKAGDFLCRGEAGELWPQAEKSLNERYSATGTTTADGWQEYAPRPDAEGALAAQVSHPFTVTATWGVLTGKQGDYVLKQFADREVAFPEDVWIVDQALFRATYEPVKQ